MRWLVDGMNVIGSRPDGWWRDRPGAARRLTGRLQGLAAQSNDEITVVFEGEPIPDLTPGRHDGVVVLHARRRGQNAADDRIVEEVAADEDPRSLSVVTSDRDLARRVSELGASVVGPTALLGRLSALRPSPARDPE
ncbi:MAG: NYN domain-containing protein [Actinomycetota bacterium]|nr:NYN domain-containing protein [Actinomycetota bacterium]MDQ6946941.1 NYN domain-containing protein [Actinomycetota bacterium]